MLWFIFIAKVLIFGAILNAVYLKRNSKIETRRGEIVDIIKSVNSKKNEEKSSSWWAGFFVSSLFFCENQTLWKNIIQNNGERL